MKKFFRLLILLIILVFAGLSSFLFFPSFLTHESKIPANILVAEGWMPHYGLHKAYREFLKGDYDYLVLTGNPFPGSITMYINSYLIFYPHDSILGEDEKREHQFFMDISSTLGVRDSAHFVFWVNDQRITEHYTTEQGGRFSVKWEGSLSEMDSVMVQYTNDKVSEKGDRNLSINRLTLNGKNLIIDHADLFIDRGRPFGRYRWNVTATSYAELAAHFFVNMGIEKDRVIAVTNQYPGLRNTYGNALSLRDWIGENEPDISGINVVSMDYHSRRTWLTYRKLLGNKSAVGIISAEEITAAHSRQKKYRTIFRETAALIYYAIFILPWV